MAKSQALAVGPRASAATRTQVSTIQEENQEQDMDALIMEVWYGGLTDDHKYLGDLTLEEQLQ